MATSQPSLCYILKVLLVSQGHSGGPSVTASQLQLVSHKEDERDRRILRLQRTASSADGRHRSASPVSCLLCKSSGKPASFETASGAAGSSMAVWMKRILSGRLHVSSGSAGC